MTEFPEVGHYLMRAAEIKNEEDDDEDDMNEDDDREQEVDEGEENELSNSPEEKEVKITKKIVEEVPVDEGWENY
jgi:hypothetical protein